SSRHGLPGAPLVRVRSGVLASRRISAVGSPRMGRAAVGRPAPAGRGVSAQLAVVSAASTRRAYPARMAAWVFHFDPLLRGAVLLLALPGPRPHDRRVPLRRFHLWRGR